MSHSGWSWLTGLVGDVMSVSLLKWSGKKVVGGGGGLPIEVGVMCFEVPRLPSEHWKVSTVIFYIIV